MKVGIRERIEVRITKTLTEDLSKELRGRGVPQIENIRVGPFMKVHLTGGDKDSFDIKTLTKQRRTNSRR
jgi:phosphoribosylformylglycinamidine (FGAM) synthase PurS component